jgi:hypothetical protein
MPTNLSKFFRTETGKHIMSAILGFGLATLFRTVCTDRNCIVFEAPPLDDIEGKIFKHGEKCYKFKSVSTKCDSSKKTISANA